jgi:hypothetical protein
MAPRKQTATRKQPRTLRVEVGGPRGRIPAKKIAQAIQRKLAAERTDVFAHDDTLILIVQHQVRGRGSSE